MVILFVDAWQNPPPVQLCGPDAVCAVAGPFLFVVLALDYRNVYHTRMASIVKWSANMRRMRKKVEVWENRCERCGHVWLSRIPEPPITCPNPKCRSPYWQRPR